MKLFRFLYFPLSLVYGLAIRVRNRAFDWNILRQVSFPVPIIAVGNLKAGGSGKTPLVEYIVDMLGACCNVAILSRGYKRETKGYRLAGTGETAATIGDEPLQYHLKYDKVKVAVCENRREGISRLMKDGEAPDIILLDDAFQHRYVKAGLSILATEYYKPYTRDWLLPYGRLREPASGSKRADIIVVTKTPKIFSPIIRKQLLEELHAEPSQLVCFSYIHYRELVPVYKNTAVAEANVTDVYSIIMLTGIGNPDPFEEFLRRSCSDLEIFSFSDHHVFSDAELKGIAEKFRNLPTKRKIIVTTEKDSMRLQTPEATQILGELPVYYVPISFEFHAGDKEAFDHAVMNMVKSSAAAIKKDSE